MTDKQKTAYDWAKAHPDYRSIAAGHARELAGLVDELMDELDAAKKDIRSSMMSNAGCELCAHCCRGGKPLYRPNEGYLEFCRGCYDLSHFEWRGGPAQMAIKALRAQAEESD